MDKVNKISGMVVPINRSNVDTDAIIPKQFLKSIKRSGFGINLFDEWRYLDQGEPDSDNSLRPLNADFVLNQKRYQGANILLAGENFGCGSSREHAQWALKDYGIDAIIAPSFGDIFYNNCFKNALLPIRLDIDTVNALFALVAKTEGYALSIELAKQSVHMPELGQVEFVIDEFFKKCLLEGLDDIALTLKKADAIKTYEAAQRLKTPWLFEKA